MSMDPKSSLPTDNAWDKAVNTFGLGLYDETVSRGGRGEDSNQKEPHGKSLPDGGGSYDPFGPDRIMGYPDSMVSTTRMPGDLDRRPMNYRSDTIEDPIMTMGYAELPQGNDGPVARSDYYDRLVTGAIGDIWPSDSGDVFAGEEDSLPKEESNFSRTQNNLQSLGNFWSGFQEEDQNVPYGFPSDDYSLDNSPTISDSRMGTLVKTAGNAPKVRSLLSEFFKEFGKKDLTKRHFLSFLTSRGLPQYLSSEMILCAAEDHNVIVKDVLDEFPFKKSASSGLRDSLINEEIINLRNPIVSKAFRLAAAAVCEAEVYLVKKVRP